MKRSVVLSLIALMIILVIALLVVDFFMSPAIIAEGGNYADENYSLTYEDRTIVYQYDYLCDFDDEAMKKECQKRLAYSKKELNSSQELIYIIASATLFQMPVNATGTNFAAGQYPRDQINENCSFIDNISFSSLHDPRFFSNKSIPDDFIFPGLSERESKAFILAAITNNSDLCICLNLSSFNDDRFSMCNQFVDIQSYIWHSSSMAAPDIESSLKLCKNLAAEKNIPYSDDKVFNCITNAGIKFRNADSCLIIDDLSVQDRCAEHILEHLHMKDDQFNQRDTCLETSNAKWRDLCLANVSAKENTTWKTTRPNPTDFANKIASYDSYSMRQCGSLATLRDSQFCANSVALREKNPANCAMLLMHGELGYCMGRSANHNCNDLVPYEAYTSCINI